MSLVYGILRLVNFAYGDIMAFGALIAYGVDGPLHSVDGRRDARRDGGHGRALARCSTSCSGSRCARGAQAS